MTFQKVIAFYYVLVDVVLVAQWRWYNRPAALQDARRQSASGRDKESRSTTSHPAASVDASPRTTPPRPSNVFMTLALLFNLVRAAPIASSSSAVTTLLDDASLRTLGMLLGWSSTILYLSSRLPQIYLNHKRRSVAGLSPLLFAAAFCGNFFYSSSLLLNPQAWSDLPAYGEHGWVGPEGSSAAAWWTDTLPFLLGSAGVLSMDGYIGLQFWKWGGQEEPEGEQEDAREVIVGVDAYDSDDDHRIRQGTGKAVEVNTKERSYFDEQTALLARMNGVYGTSAESSRSAELRR
ncbi:hypothetical protein DRE_07658 [Drechslerella stenobrocha 248]|uniref:Uncharacterized protein n=1 Tax=Drechslerella stenobrocha 248 TaxID=1043628 RepID=W7HHR1_9PEZI|nr:hypothetical protein DRE_07658 [Drechslerella stenobrocha 248]